MTPTHPLPWRSGLGSWGSGEVGKTVPACLSLRGETVALGTMTGDGEERVQVLRARDAWKASHQLGFEVWMISQHRGKSWVRRSQEPRTVRASATCTPLANNEAWHGEMVESQGPTDGLWRREDGPARSLEGKEGGREVP